MNRNFCICLLVFFVTACKSKDKTTTITYDDGLLQRVRVAAATIPGPLPTAINYTKFAASIRKWKDVVEDGSDDACTMARTAFQIEFSDGFIMVDAGMDKAVQHFFEKDSPQPYDDTAAAKVASSLQQARLILITHEHGDHVAGVIRNGNNIIPPKTILTKEQAETLIHDPQMPEIKLDEEKSKQFIITDFESILPVAPGIVLIKAPGHTKGEIMIYAKLQSGKEYIFAGDVSWSFKGVQEKKQKPKSERKRISEDANDIEPQLAWLNERLTKDNMVILVSHDDVMMPQYAAQGFIHNGFK